MSSGCYSVALTQNSSPRSVHQIVLLFFSILYFFFCSSLYLFSLSLQKLHGSMQMSPSVCEQVIREVDVYAW